MQGGNFLRELGCLRLLCTVPVPRSTRSAISCGSGTLPDARLPSSGALVSQRGAVDPPVVRTRTSIIGTYGVSGFSVRTSVPMELICECDARECGRTPLCINQFVTYVQSRAFLSMLLAVIHLKEVY